MELEGDLLDLALFYLQLRRKRVTAYNLLSTCARILHWSEQKGKGHKNGSKLVFKPGRILVNEKYSQKFGSQG